MCKKEIKNPATCSQERKGDNPCQGSRWKQQQSDVRERSGSRWKEQQGIENLRSDERARLHFHNMQISDKLYVEKVFDNLRQKLRLSSYTLDAKTNVLLWRPFMPTTMKSSVHLGLQYQENLTAYRNTDFEELKTLFDITQRLIVEQSFEILNVSARTWSFTPWKRSTLCHDQVIKWAKAKVHVYSDSFLSGKDV